MALSDFSPSPVPKVLRLPNRKVAAAYIGIPTLAVLLAIIVTNEIQQGVPSLADALLLLPFVLMVPGLFVLLWMGTQRKTTLWPDRVEVFDGFALHVFSADEIRGFKRERGASTVKLIPKDPRMHPIDVPLSVLAARAHVPWLQSLRNLARDELTALTLEIEADPRLGAIVPARRARLKQLRSQAKMVSIGAWLAAAWIWLWPAPYSLAMIVGTVLPLIAVGISVRTQGFYRLDARREDPRPSLAALFFAPTFAIFIRALSDINGVDFLAPILVAIICAGGLTILALQADKRLEPQHWWIAFIATGAFLLSLSALMHFNVAFSGARSEVFRAKVEDAYVTSGKAHLSQLQLAPWGPFARSAAANVPASFFDTVNKGDTVCVRLYDGALTWRWFEIVHCAR